MSKYCETRLPLKLFNLSRLLRQGCQVRFFLSLRDIVTLDEHV